MSDSLNAYLVDRTTHTNQSTKPLPPFVIRCIPYGPLRDVMPYLARRAVENRSVLGSSDSASVSHLGSAGVSGEDERGTGQGRAAEERKRIGGLIWERAIKFWTF